VSTYEIATARGPLHRDSQGVAERNHCTEMCSGSEAGSYLRLIDSCITQLIAQRLSRTCNESKQEESAIQPADLVSVPFSSFNDFYLKVKAIIWP